MIKYNAREPEAAKRYADIAKFIGLCGNTNEELVDALIAHLRKMNEALGDYDLDGFGSVLKKMSKFKVTDEQRRLLEQMKTAGDDFDYDALEELIGQWK